MGTRYLTTLFVLTVIVAVAADWSFSGTASSEEKFVNWNGERFPALGALGPPPIPLDNPQSVDDKGFPTLDDPKVQLGYLLFFDPRLSGDASAPCSLCHVPKEGWGLAQPISRGYPGTSHWRKSQTVVNTAYLGRLFWAARVTSLEAQAPAAATGAVAGNGRPDMMEERLRQVPEYVKQFRQVFGSEWPEIGDAWRAISAFQRALNDVDTPFDRYMRGDTKALTPKQVKGMELFQGKAGCIQCHNGPNLTDEKMYNLGVPPQPSFDEDPLLQITHRFQHYSQGAAEAMYRTSKVDLGLYYRTKRPQDMGKFRTPPLRHALHNPPYMHNGVFDTFEEVVEFFNAGGGEDPIEQLYGFSTKTPRLKPLGLTKQEKDALVAFLESLSGKEILLPQPKIPDDAVMK